MSCFGRNRRGFFSAKWLRFLEECNKQFYYRVIYMQVVT